MVKLEIKKIEGTDGLSLHSYLILIDGHEPTMLTGLELTLNEGEFNQATLTVGVEDLKVDGDFLALVKAKVEEKDSASGAWHTFNEE